MLRAIALMKEELGLKEIEVIDEVRDWLILNTLKEDGTRSHEEALLKIYLRLRPGNPAQIEKAKDLFKDKFENESKYRLGRVGREGTQVDGATKIIRQLLGDRIMQQ